MLARASHAPYFSRKTAIADQVRKLYRAGISKAEIARRLKIGRTSVRHILNQPTAP